MTTASKPERLSVAGKRPPKVESKKSPVSGDFEATQARLLPGTVVSVIGPTLKTTAVSGANGSVFSVGPIDRKSTRLNSSHGWSSCAGCCCQKQRLDTAQDMAW